MKRLIPADPVADTLHRMSSNRSRHFYDSYSSCSARTCNRQYMYIYVQNFFYSCKRSGTARFATSVTQKIHQFLKHKMPSSNHAANMCWHPWCILTQQHVNQSQESSFCNMHSITPQPENPTGLSRLGRSPIIHN